MTKEDVLEAIERGRRLAQQNQSQTGPGVTSSSNSIDKLRESVIRRPLTQAAQQQANQDAERFVQQQNALMGGSMSYNQYQNALNSTRQALNNQYQKEYNNQYDYLTNYTQYDYTGKSREEAEARLNELNRELHTAGSDGHQRAVVQEMQDAQNYIDSLMSVDEVNAKISELKKQRDEISADWQKVQDTTNDFDYYKKRAGLYGTQIKDINNQIDRYSGAVLSNAYAQEDKNLLGALSDEEKQNLSDYYNSLRYITSEEGNLPGKAAQQEWIRQNEIYNNAKKSLEGKYTQEQINRLAEALEYTQNAELRQTMQEDFASMAQNARVMSDKIPQSSLFTSVSSSAPQAFSEGLPILGQTVLEGVSTIASPIENTATLIHSLFNERPIDYNDPIYALTNMSNDLSTALVEANADRKLYPIVNGMARVIGSLGGAAIAGGGNAKLVKFFMGNNAASNAALEMAERGGSNADIVGTAIAAAVAEMIFEGTFDRAVGLGDETARILSSSKPVLEGVKSFFKSIGAEVSEEVSTDIANTLYDTIINGDMSDYSTTVNEYIRQGMSEKEAQKQWAKDFGMQLKDTVIISALMGGLLSGGGYVGNVRQARANNQALQVLQEAQSLPPQEANALMTGFVNSGQSRAEADAILKQASEVIAQQQVQNAQPLDFMQSVDKARLDTNSESIKNLNTLFKNRGIEASVQDIFNDSNIAGIWTAEERDGKTVRRVVFNPNATTQQWIQNTAIHELWHDMSASKTLSEIAELIKGYNLTKSEYETAYKALEQEYAKIYDPNSADFNSLVEEEAVASVLGSRLGTQEFVNELVNSKPTVAKKIYDWVVDKLNKLNKLTGYRNEKLFWKDIENKFRIAYGEEFSGKVDKKYSTANVDVVNDFKKIVDDIDKNVFAPDDNNILVCETPKILQDIGLNPLPMTITYKHLYLAIKSSGKFKGKSDHYHGLGADTVKKIPNAIANPLMVISSSSKPKTSVIVITILKDSQGQDVIVPIHVDGEGNIYDIEMDSNVITSIYGRNKGLRKILKDAVNEYTQNGGGFYYIKKNSLNYLQTTGVQFPRHLTSNKDYINIISKSNSNVNIKLKNITESRQFKDWFGDWENNPQSIDTLLLNDDGTPRTWYHQTEAEITEFDLSKMTNSRYDSETPNGVFLKSSNKDIGLRGKSQMQLYATADKILKFKNREEASRWYQENISGYREITDEINRLDEIYQEKYDKQEQLCDEFYEEHYDDVISGKMSEEEFQQGSEEGLDEILAEWKEKTDSKRALARELLNNYFSSSDYDGIYLEYDAGSFGRETDALIIFNRNNVKSATDNIGTFDKNNPDIRYFAETDKWQTYVDRNFAPNGTGQSIKDLRAVDSTASFNAENSVKSQVMPDLDLESFKGSIESRYLSGEKLTAESVTSARERATNAVRKKSLEETRDYLATYLSDEAYVVDKATRNKQDRIVYEVYTDATSGTAKALMNMGMQSGNKFIGALTDASGKIVNKSVSELLNPFKNADFNQLGLENPTKSEIKEAQKQYWQDTQDYLYLLHNLDCINNGKPRLIDLNEADTRNRVAELEKAHPEFKSDLIKARNTITDFILQYEIDTGRITQEEADAWKKLYPNYVPTFREIEGEVSQSLLKAGADYNARARAKGSALKLLPLDESIFRKLDHATVYGQRNLFFNQMLKAGMENEQLADHYKILKVIDDVKGMSTREVLGETAKQKNTYIAYTSNGGAIVFQANNNLNVAIEGIVSSQYEIDQYLKTWQAVNRLFRAGVTTANPLFLASNATRDFQEALYYTSDVEGFLKAYPEAVKQIRENGELYQQFMASGIMEVSDVASDGSIKANLKQKLGFIKRANDVVEMLPRFTEYIRTINELGNTYEGRLRASYNAKEITTNFSRGGKFTKFLNRNGFNFLNASVQGGSKFIRQISETIDNGKATGATYARVAMSASAVIIKGIMWGMAPQLLNELICSFFEGYDELDDSSKQQYYLIPAKDGKFIGIPKGRAMVVGAVMGNSLVRIAKGEEVDPVEDIKTIWENIGVSKPTGLWTPIVDAMNNRTWYGGTLINQSLSQKPNAEQYDESTDDISKYLGKLFNIPPKAINYVLDQWSGVLGDFLLPMITDKTKGGTLWEYAIANPVKKRFTVDSVTNNKISGEYYDEVNAVKTELKSDNAPANATLVNKYFNEQTDAVNDVWEKIHQIQNYSNLTPIEQKALDSEFKEYGDLSQYKVRTEVIRDSRKIINGIQRNALENLEAVNTVSKKYADKYLVGDYTGTDVNNAYLEMNYNLFGAEYALKNHYGDVYIKAQEANAVGIDYDSYYQYYIATKDLNAKDENGNSVTGLKKERVMEAIESLDLSAGQKAFLFAESGYKLNSSMKSQLWNYIESLKLSASEKQAIYDELTE